MHACREVHGVHACFLTFTEAQVKRPNVSRSNAKTNALIAPNSENKFITHVSRYN